MIIKEEFSAIRKDLQKLEDLREKTIKISRSIINFSKQIIHRLHKEEIKEAEGLIKYIKKEINRLPKDTNLDVNINLVAVQEYVEALSYYYILKENRIPTRKDLKVNTIEYLTGLCDLSGELIRRITNSLIKDDFEEAKRIKNFISDLYHEFIHLDIHHGELRKKSDMLRWNLEKAEDILLRAKGR